MIFNINKNVIKYYSSIKSLDENQRSESLGKFSKVTEAAKGKAEMEPKSTLFFRGGISTSLQSQRSSLYTFFLSSFSPSFFPFFFPCVLPPSLPISYSLKPSSIL